MAPTSAIQIGDWIVEPALDSISCGSRTQKLEPRTMRLLMCLAESAGSVVSIDQLLDEVWSGVVVSHASVYQAVSQLRKILGDTGTTPTYIATVPRKGYRLIVHTHPVAPGVMTAGAVDALSPPVATAPPSIPVIQPPVPVHDGRRRAWVAALALALIVALTLAAKKIFFDQSAEASIVVLPFVDMTADKANQPFCDGLTEELSNWLAQIPTLRVVARTSAFSFRERATDVRTIGRELDTSRVLEGSMRRFGDHMRITVQLIDARSGYHLWSATYDRAMADTINLQEDISRSVASALAVRLTIDTTRHFASRRSDNGQAYQLYLQARHYQQERTPQANDRAMQLYRQALAADPSFALADVGLAYAMLNQNWLGDRPITAIAAEADPLLARAIELNPELSDAYAVRGALRAEQFQTAAALQDLQHAIRLNPNDSVAHTELGRLYLYGKAQPRDALDSYTRATVLDPLNSLPQAQRCIALQDLGEFDEAAKACTRARELDPQSYWPLDATGWLASAQGRLEEALEWNDKAITLSPTIPSLHRERAELLLTLGRSTEARTTTMRAQSLIGESEAVDDLMARVEFYDGGVPALARYLQSSHMAESSHSDQLFSAAYFLLMAGDAAGARTAAQRARSAADYAPNSDTSALQAARWGHSDELTLALVDLANGDTASGARRLNTLAAMLDHLVQNGDKRYGVDELYASVLALRGDGDGAMRYLAQAVKKGWRRAWWAQREPDLAALRPRPDFHALMTRVLDSNKRQGQPAID